jgi:hypothetical protein
MKATLVLAIVFSVGALTSPVWVPAAEPAIRMVIVKGKDVTGQVFKRLGLPNQDYCWQQCVQDERCTGTRWGVVAGSEAGQCQLMSGELTFGPPHDIRTQDGKRIEVSASRKESGERKGDKSGV